MEESTKNTELAIAVCSDARESEALENLNDRALLYNKDDNTLGVKYDGNIHKSAPLKNNKIPEEFLPGPILMYRGTFETEPVYESPNTPKEGDVWAATTNTTLSNGLKVIAGSVIFRKNGDWAPLGGGSGSVNSINKTGEKLYLLGATTQDEAVETFSNENVYIDEDGVIQGTAAFANTSGYAEMAEFSSSAEVAAFASEAQSAETAKSAETANSAIYDGDGNEISKTYVPLDENNRISYQYLPESAMEFKGAWTPTPDGAAPSSNPTKGDFYIIATTGVIAGEDYNANDRTIYDGTKWVKLPGGDSSINDETESHTTTWSSTKIQTEISNVKVDLTAATTEALGGIKLGYTRDDTNKNYPVQLSNEKAYVNVPWKEYSSLGSAQNGTSLSLVTTGEKYNWGNGAIAADNSAKSAAAAVSLASISASSAGAAASSALTSASNAGKSASNASISASSAGVAAGYASSYAAAANGYAITAGANNVAASSYAVAASSYAAAAAGSASGMASATSAAARATSAAATATSVAATATSVAAKATSTASLALPTTGGTLTGTLTTRQVTIGSGYNLILSKNASTTEGAIWYT